MKFLSSGDLFIDVTGTNHIANKSGGAHNFSGAGNPVSRVAVSHCILRNNAAEDSANVALLPASYIEVEYSNMEGGYDGVFGQGDFGTTQFMKWLDGNIDQDPRLIGNTVDMGADEYVE